MTVEKWCRRCDETKPVDEFRRYAANADGRRGTCKACQKLVAADPKPAATGVRQLNVRTGTAETSPPPTSKGGRGVNVDKPAPPTGTRRPWDDVLAEFAARTGRPLWPVTRTMEDRRQRKLTPADRRAIVDLYDTTDLSVYDIAKPYGVSIQQVYMAIRAARKGRAA